eukprot:8858458-Heterocapsa_arctica.AAC.1
MHHVARKPPRLTLAERFKGLHRDHLLLGWQVLVEQGHAVDQEVLDGQHQALLRDDEAHGVPQQ